MRPIRGGAVVLALAASIVGCAEDQAEPVPTSTTLNSASECEAGEDCRAATAQVPPEDCDRGAAGQVSCLSSAFEVATCDGAQVLGSMFRDNEQSETFEHRTAYGISNACLADLQKSAKRRNFRENDKGELVAKPRSGYRETLIVGLQISADGNIVEWERVKE